MQINDANQIKCYAKRNLPNRIWPLQPRSFFSISSRKISPGCNGFSLKVSALPKLAFRYATVFSLNRIMF